MNAWIFSDLHLPNANSRFDEVFPDGVPDADVAICLGDLVEGEPYDAVHWLADNIPLPIIFVLGNHEFYRDRDIAVARGLAQRAGENRGVHVLDDRSVVIDGVRFVGSTLWSDFQLFGNDTVDIAHAMNAASRSVIDFRLIPHGRGRWTPDDARRQHFESLALIDAELAQSDEPCVVVTHHAPAIGSLAPEFATDLVSAAFVSRLDDVIENRQPLAWFHGHTHSSFDYSIGQTRIVCNPRGYGLENAAGWQPSMVIDFDEFLPRPKF